MPLAGLITPVPVQRRLAVFWPCLACGWMSGSSLHVFGSVHGTLAVDPYSRRITMLLTSLVEK